MPHLNFIIDPSFFHFDPAYFKINVGPVRYQGPAVGLIWACVPLRVLYRRPRACMRQIRRGCGCGLVQDQLCKSTKWVLHVGMCNIDPAYIMRAMRPGLFGHTPHYRPFSQHPPGSPHTQASALLCGCATVLWLAIDRASYR